MKSMREMVSRKLKFISTISNLKQGLVFQVNAVDQCEEHEHSDGSFDDTVPHKIRLSELINSVEDKDIDQGLNAIAIERQLYEQPVVQVMDDREMELTPEFESETVSTVTLQENIQPQPQSCDFQLQTLTYNGMSFDAVRDKSQGLLSSTLAPSEAAVFEDRSTINVEKDDLELYSSLSDFKENCPPGGSNSVILYTTSLRGIRKTFEECSTIRFLLESFRILYHERDVSMHMEFREELWRIMKGRVVPPRLFIRGRLIGGADEVVRLHEQGKLKKLLEGIPATANNFPCSGCAGVHFVLCVNCSGSRKIKVDDQDCEMPVRCPGCNENGLVQCPICS